MSFSLRFHAPTPLEYFAALVDDEHSLQLLEAAIAIGMDEVPKLDVQGVLSEIDELALRLKRRLPADAGPSQRLQLLTHYFHHELGFAGNVNNYYERGNSYVHQVLSSRRGIPITLALIFMELATQLGLHARGVSFPGHFLVKLRLPHGELLLDPFSGQSVSREALAEQLAPLRQESSLPSGVELPLEVFLQSATPREILARMLRNLKAIHLHAQDWPRLLAVQHRLVLLLPGEPVEWRDRGLTLETLGQWQSAAEDLAHYLEQCPGAADHEGISARLRALRGRDAPRWH